MAGTPIDYVCVRAEHNRILFAARMVHTVHEGRWAYCPSGATGAHEWITAGGANLEGLSRVGVHVPAAQESRGRDPSARAQRAETAMDRRAADGQREGAKVTSSG